MATKQIPETVELVDERGVTVKVAAEKVDRLVAGHGYRHPGTKPTAPAKSAKPASTAKKASSSTAKKATSAKPADTAEKADTAVSTTTVADTPPA